MEIGERWAYRANRNSKFAEVRILKIGISRPPRVKVEYVDDKFEGKQQWVSPARLEVAWARFADYVLEDERWKALNAAPEPSDLDWDAAHTVWFAAGPDDDSFVLKGQGICRVENLDTFCSWLGIARDDIAIDPLAIQATDGLFLPWSTTLPIIRAMASRFSVEVLRYIENEERTAERESVLGYDSRWTRNDPVVHVSGERVARHYEEHIAPVHQVVRAWLGEDVSRERFEIIGLQRELSRVGEIAMSAIAELKQLRSNRTADKLLEQLLNPPSRWQGYGVDGALVEQPMAKYKWVQVMPEHNEDPE